MKILKTGNYFSGNGFADMVNDAIGTDFGILRRCTAKLDDFGATGVNAWFVQMNDSVNGYPFDWLWANKISEDGRTIREKWVGRDKNKHLKDAIDNSQTPFLLAFQLDALKGVDKRWCKFVGAFGFSRYLNEELTEKEYVKVSDEFVLGSRGEHGKNLDSRKLFTNAIDKDCVYYKPLGEMGFDDGTCRLLTALSLRNAGQLIETDFSEASDRLRASVRQKLRETFIENKIIYNVRA